MTPQKVINFKKFLIDFLLEIYSNKNWYHLEFELTGSDLGFKTRF